MAAPRFAVTPDLPAKAGLGLKPQHFEAVLATRPELGFFEVHAENYMVAGGPFHHSLGRIREQYALSLHGVGLSIGSEAGLDLEHIARLEALMERYQPQSFSEHLAWSSHGGAFFNDLLPVPYNEQTLARVCAHVDQVQSLLRRRILIENPSTYVEFDASTLGEAEFLSALVQRSGCGLLLDVNNAYLSCVNHQRDPYQLIDAMPLAQVGEIHLAGFAVDQDGAGAPLLIDSHGTAVHAQVWRLYAHALERIGPVATLIERDNNIPIFAVLMQEAQQAQTLLDQCALKARGLAA